MSQPQPITRQTFICEEQALQIAVNLPTMFVITASEDGTQENLEEIPVPSSVKETGKLPDGYTVDFALDPDILVEGLRAQDITNVHQLSAEILTEMRDVINAKNNINIVPISLFLAKRKLDAQAITETLRVEREDGPHAASEESSLFSRITDRLADMCSE